ncbi:unnamed protein product [Calicophoron daubneyi]
MHFYMRVCTQNLINAWKSKHGLNFLGIPRYVSSGLFTPTGQKPCRFLIMDRYTADLESVLKKNGLTPSGVVKVAVNVLNALEYIHSKDYAHADIKASNLLYMHNPEEVSLVDFGLAHLYRVNGVHAKEKTDPKYRHNGTLEFCSRDAHRGLPPAPRGDLEILVYNLVHWLARCQPGAPQLYSTGLPWGYLISDPSLRSNPSDQIKTEVAALKEVAVKDVTKLTEKCGVGPDSDLNRFIHSVVNLRYEETPNYTHLRHLLMGLQKEVSGSNRAHADSRGKASKRTSDDHVQSASDLSPSLGLNRLAISSNPKSNSLPKRPRGRPPGARSRKAESDSSESSSQLASMEAVGAEVNGPISAGKKHPTGLIQKSVPSRGALNDTKKSSTSRIRTFQSISSPVRSSPRLQAQISGDSGLSSRLPLARSPDFNDLFSDEEFESFQSISNSVRAGRTPDSSRKPLKQLSTQPSPLVFGRHPNHAIKPRAIGRQSACCQTSPELLMLAKADALGRRAGAFTNRRFE